MALFKASDGRRLAYHMRGRGRPLICHPGGPGLSSRLLGDLGGLDQERSLVLLDPRGTGLSDRPPHEDSYLLADYAADVELLRDHLGLDRIALLGHSAGSSIALTYAEAYPERVECLVLVGAAARFADEHVPIAEAMCTARSDEPWYADAVATDEAYARVDRSVSDAEFGQILARRMGFCFVRYGPREAAYAAMLRDEGVNVAAWLSFDESADLRPLLARISVPTLVVVGAYDCVTVPAAGREVAEGLPESRIVVLPDAGHYPWVDQPDQFCATVSAFLSGQTANRGTTTAGL